MDLPLVDDDVIDLRDDLDHDRLLLGRDAIDEGQQDGQQPVEQLEHRTAPFVRRLNETDRSILVHPLPPRPPGSLVIIRLIVTKGRQLEYLCWFNQLTYQRWSAWYHVSGLFSRVFWKKG